MLPKSWRCTTVGEACSIKNNLRLPLNSEQRSGMQGPYPYFGPTGVLGYIDHYRIDEEFAVIGEDGDHFLKFRNRPMTLLFNGKANVNNHAHIIGNSEQCLARWFYYWFMHRELTPVLSRQGVGRYKLTKAGLEELEIWLPPKLEQVRITGILSTWDDAIAATERLLANSRKQKQTLMHRLLASGSASTDWGKVQIREIADRVTRGAESDDKSYPILMISSSSGFVRQDEQYGRYMAGKSVENYVLLHKGEFAYNKGNSKRFEFGCVFPLENYEQGLVPHVYVCFALRKECDPTFYKYLFEADYLHDQLGALVNTGVRNNGLLNIRPADFLGVTVPLPPAEDQRRIVAIVSTASNSTVCLERDLNALSIQKRGLMRQLLSGKRRVRLPESVSEVAA